MRKVAKQRFYGNYKKEIQLYPSLVPVIYKRKTYHELKDTHDEVVSVLSDLITQLESIKDYNQFFETEELEFHDIMFAILIGLVGTFITTNEKLKEFLRLFHDTPKTADNPTDLQKAAHNILKHPGQSMDTQDGKFINRDGGNVPFGFHRLFYGHDILSWKGDNPFSLLISQFGFLEGIKKAFLHLIADTCSKQGLPVPGHSLFDIKSGDGVSNVFYEASKAINPGKIQAVYQNLFTVNARDILGGSATVLLSDVYLGVCNYKNVKSKSIFKMIVHITNFVITAIIGAIKQGGTPKINFIALFNFMCPLASFIGVKFKEGKIKRIEREYIANANFMLEIKKKIYAIYKKNYALILALLLAVLGLLIFYPKILQKKPASELVAEADQIITPPAEEPLQRQLHTITIFQESDRSIFVKNVAELLPDAGSWLDGVAEKIKQELEQNPDKNVMVIGYAAIFPGLPDPVELSRERATRVKMELVKRNIPIEKIESVAGGETSDFGVSREENRRIKILVK